MVNVENHIPNRFKGKIPFFSIIVVSYNSLKTLPRTMNAIKKQSFTNYEIVFVNNGSVDKTDKYIRSFIKKNPDIYITYVTIDVNEGLPLGRNMGIENAHGKYIIFNDSDDWMEKDCLKEMYLASDRGKVDRMVVQIRDVNSEGKILQTRNFTDKMSRYLLTLLQGNAFKREYFDKYNIRVPDNLMDDMYVTLKFSGHTSSYFLIKKTLYNFRIDNNSTSGINNNSEISKLMKYMDDLIKCIDSVKHDISKEDWEILEYQLIKCYYSLLYNYNRNRKLSDISKVYHLMHKKMLAYDEKYLRNRYLRLFSNSSDRLYGRLITHFSAFFEKLHLMSFLLCIYVLLSKLLYFRI